MLGFLCLACFTPVKCFRSVRVVANDNIPLFYSWVALKRVWRQKGQEMKSELKQRLELLQSTEADPSFLMSPCSIRATSHPQVSLLHPKVQPCPADLVELLTFSSWHNRSVVRTPRFLYPFISWWTLRSFPSPSYSEWCCSDRGSAGLHSQQQDCRTMW